MPLWKQWSAGGAVWGIWKVTESPSELRAMLVEQLPYETELGSLKSPSRKLEYLVVRVLLKALAGEEFDIAHLPSGQPYLKHDSRRITISHTKGYVAVGIHPSALPGIDIEQVAERVLKVTSRFIRSDEFPEKERLPAELQLKGALLHWSGKKRCSNYWKLTELISCHIYRFSHSCLKSPVRCWPESIGPARTNVLSYHIWLLLILSAHGE